jgi:multiple sugar transport system permease protein
MQDRPWDVLVFLLPGFLGLCIFTLFPIIASIGLSFTNYKGGNTIAFTGLRNYIVAFQSSSFQRSIWVTAIFVLFTVFFEIVLGLMFAQFLNRKIVGRNFFRGIFFLPVVLSTIAVSLVFKLIFNPQSGPVNGFLMSIGFGTLPWLASSKTALMTIIIVTVWQQSGYYMIILLSGLQVINPELYEAAEIDGANSVRKFRYVTLPMLSPVLFLCIILALIRAFQVFDQIFMLTGGHYGGGPAGSTTTLVFDIYLSAFCNWQMGYGSAEATILLIIVLVITVIQYKRQEKWVTYDIT